VGYNGLSAYDIERIAEANPPSAVVQAREDVSPCTSPQDITAPLAAQSCALFVFAFPEPQLKLNVLLRSSVAAGGFMSTIEGESTLSNPDGALITYGMLCNRTSAPSSSVGILAWSQSQYHPVPRPDGTRDWIPYFPSGTPLPAASYLVSRVDLGTATSPYAERPYISAYTPNSLVEVRRLDASTGMESSALYMQTSRGLDFLQRNIYHGDFLDVENMLVEHQRVLDAGTGLGSLVIDLQARGIDAYGIDLELEDRVRTIPNLIEGDMTHMPYADGFFHVIYSTYTIFTGLYEASNTPLIIAALREFARVLADGGHIRIAPFEVSAIDEILARDVPELEITRRDTTRESGSASLVEFRRRPRVVVP
jgi:SAM-dependent methyltransferase